MKYKYILDKDNLVYRKVPITFKSKLNEHKYKIIIGATLGIALIIMFFANTLPSPELQLLNHKEAKLIAQIDYINQRFDTINNFLLDVQDRDEHFYRVVSKSAPISDQIRKQGFGGINSYKNLEDFKSANLLINSNKRSDILIKQLHFQKKSLDNLYVSVSNLHDSILAIPGIYPISPYEYHRISSPFGYRADPMSGRRKLHAGIDFAAREGIPIYATGDGVVEQTKHSNVGYGNRIKINHGFGYQTIYAHLSKIFVYEGEHIKRGQQIGTVGNTGKSTGPHLHYEVIVNKKKINPKHFYINDLSKEEFNLVTTKY